MRYRFHFLSKTFSLTESAMCVDYRNNSLKLGFTLAEVLITLGIIGIVASLVLPMLVGKIKDKIFITQTKKTYAIVQTAFNQWKFDKGCSDYACLFEQSKSKVELANEFFSYFKTAKVCSIWQSGCSAEFIKYPKATNDGNGQISVVRMRNFYRAVLEDGSVIGIIPYVGGDENCGRIFVDKLKDENGNFIPDGQGGYKTKETYSRQCGIFLIDANGLKAPNQLGADVYSFIIGNKKINGWHTNINTVLVDEKLNYTNYSSYLDIKAIGAY